MTLVLISPPTSAIAAVGPGGMLSVAKIFLRSLTERLPPPEPDPPDASGRTGSPCITSTAYTNPCPDGGEQASGAAMGA